MIRLTDLRVRRGGRLVLKIDELELDGQLVAVMGPNGAGKTTLLQALHGVLPSQGRIEAPGTWYLAAEPPAPVLVGVDEVVRSHGADEPATWLAKVGYDGPDQLSSGSSGERTLVALAGALSHEAPWLLLDEPFGHLDPPHISRLLPALRERAHNGGVLVTTHDPAMAAQADRVILLDRSVVADGKAREVLQPEPLSRCYGAQVQVTWTELGPVVRAMGDRPNHGDTETRNGVAHGEEA